MRRKIPSATFIAFVPVLAAMFSSFACSTWAGNPKQGSDATPLPEARATVDFSLSVAGGGEFSTNGVAVTSRAGEDSGMVKSSVVTLCIADAAVTVEGIGATDTIRFAGPYVIDLLTRQATPPFAQTSVRHGKITRVEFTLHKLASGEVAGIESSHPLLSHSFAFVGSYRTLLGQERPLTVLSSRTDAVALTAVSGVSVTVPTDGLARLMVVFSPATWFDFKPRSSSQPEADLGEFPGQVTPIVLDENSLLVGKRILAAVENNVLSHLVFGVDDNGNGVLEPEEDSE